MDTYGIKFKCALLQYEALPKEQLKRKYGLDFNYYEGFGFVRSFCGRFRGREKELNHEDAKNILWHINEFGLKED